MADFQFGVGDSVECLDGNIRQVKYRSHAWEGNSNFNRYIMNDGSGYYEDQLSLVEQDKAGSTLPVKKWWQRRK